MLELKTTPPVLRPSLVERGELLSKLKSSSSPVVVLIAPAGYGKTTILAQFATRAADRPVAWLNLDEGDNDPAVLLSNIRYTLSKAELVLSGEPLTVDSASALTRGVDQLLESIDRAAKGVLVLDHIDELPTQSSLDVIGAIMTKARDHLQVMAATRSHMGLPLGVLRAHGDALELGAEDLAMTVCEAKDVFASVGLKDTPLEDVISHTEGWPAAVYLTARAMAAGAPTLGDDAIRGDDAYLAQYLREELIAGMNDDLESFLIRSSILSRLSGDLCDRVLGVEHSAQILNRLQESNLLVIPLDRTGTWYRYHSLLQDYLRSELHSRFPEVESDLQSRASEWFEDNGYNELAIDHARHAGDYDRVVNLLFRSARSFYASGQYETVVGWFEWLEQAEVLGDYPEMAAVGSLARALGGDSGGAERLFSYVLADSAGHRRDESELGPLSLMVRAYRAPRGLDQAMKDAKAAYDALQHDRQWGHSALGALALSTHASKGAEAADPLWADTLWRSESIGARPLAATARAARAVAAIERNDWLGASAMMEGAIEEIEEGGLHTYLTSALAYVQAARIAAHQGDLDLARIRIGAAARIRPLLTVAMPALSVLTLHQKALAYIELADIAGARRLMREAADILVLRPRLGNLVDEHEALKKTLTSLPAGQVGPSSLTGAELRLLPLLVTHLTYPEIGDRLYVSKHTVKTQAMSVYRKLGVSSRSEAVEKAREIGLIST